MRTRTELENYIDSYGRSNRHLRSDKARAYRDLEDKLKVEVLASRFGFFMADKTFEIKNQSDAADGQFYVARLNELADTCREIVTGNYDITQFNLPAGYFDEEGKLKLPDVDSVEAVIELLEALPVYKEGATNSYFVSDYLMEHYELLLSSEFKHEVELITEEALAVNDHRKFFKHELAALAKASENEPFAFTKADFEQQLAENEHTWLKKRTAKHLFASLALGLLGLLVIAGGLYGFIYLKKSQPPLDWEPVYLWLLTMGTAVVAGFVLWSNLAKVGKHHKNYKHTVLLNFLYIVLGAGLFVAYFFILRNETLSKPGHTPEELQSLNEMLIFGIAPAVILSLFFAWRTEHGAFVTSFAVVFLASFFIAMHIADKIMQEASLLTIVWFGLLWFLIQQLVYARRRKQLMKKLVFYYLPDNPHHAHVADRKEACCEGECQCKATPKSVKKAEKKAEKKAAKAEAKAAKQAKQA